MPSPNGPSVRRILLFIYWSGRILLQRYLMNDLSNFDETYMSYSLASIYDLFRFWRSKVKVTAGRLVEASTLSLGH